MKRNVFMLAACLLLVACSPMRTAQVQPAKTAIDETALQAGDLRIAASSLSSGDFPVAISMYERIIASHPDVVDAWLGLATARYLSGDISLARQAYQKAIGIDPKQLDAYLGLARLDIRQRRLPEAMARYETMRQQWPDHPLVLAGLGVTYDLAGNHVKAQEIYKQGLRQHPDDPALRSNLGLSLSLSGKPREAVNVLLDVMGVPSSLPQGRQNLAFAYGLMGRDDAAESILSSDLPRDTVQDNLAYYREVRQRLAVGQQP